MASFTSSDFSNTRARLLLNHPFFGSLAMRLKLELTDSIETASVDGVTLRANPAFMAGLSEVERQGLMAHEVGHCALGHLHRRNGRDMGKWNEAADYALNQMLVDAGLVLPQGGLLDPNYKGMAAEQIYTARASKPRQEPENGNGGSGQGKGKPGAGDQSSPGAGGKPKPGVGGKPEPGAGTGDTGQGGESAGESKSSKGKGSGAGSTGDFTDPAPAEPGTGEMSETDWQVATEMAARAAKGAGKLPGCMVETLRASRATEVDWKGILHEFVSHVTVSDFSWSKPNRRFIGQGMVLPGAVKENVGEILVGVDTSASVSTNLLNAFAREVSAIMREARPEKITVVYCDTRVNGSEVFTPDGEDVVLTAKGRGGTAFQPVFDWAKKEGIEPLCCLYLTDLDGPAPVDPGYPVMWCVPSYVRKAAPFGRIVRVPE
jgi:predicted metal-dependent peptidase